MPTKKRNRLATRLILHIATPTLERNTSGKRVIAWSHEVTGQCVGQTVGETMVLLFF